MKKIPTFQALNSAERISDDFIIFCDERNVKPICAFVFEDKSMVINIHKGLNSHETIGILEQMKFDYLQRGE